MRSGLFVPQGWRLDLVGIPREQQWPVMHDVAIAAEVAGYESIWVYDHFHTVPVPAQEVTHEAWSLMGALAVTTKSIRLGQMCTCNGYRQPSYLAKVAATVDVLSGGRLEMGIGAGWYEQEFLAYGYEFPSPAVRIGQLAEGVEIMKRMWTEAEVFFEGKHYQLQGAICQPKPLQSPHIPLWIAGGGEKLTLRVVAEHADYANFGDDLEGFKRRSNLLAEHCREIGRDFDQIVRSHNFNVICEETEAALADRMSWLREHYALRMSEDHLARRLGLFAEFSGTPEQLIDKFMPWKEAGMTYLIAYVPDAAFDRAGLERLAREVIPAL